MFVRHVKIMPFYMFLCVFDLVSRIIKNVLIFKDLRLRIHNIYNSRITALLLEKEFAYQSFPLPNPKPCRSLSEGREKSYSLF